VWPILAAGAGTPQPRPAGDALIPVRDSQVFLDYVRQSDVFVDGPAKTRPRLSRELRGQRRASLPHALDRTPVDDWAI